MIEYSSTRKANWQHCLIFVVVKRKYKVKEKREQKKKFKKKRAVPNVVPKPLPPAPLPTAGPDIQEPNEVKPMVEKSTATDVKR